jgi:multiple antibiotic resistance protein
MGACPGAAIGTMDAADINYASEYLANLVREHDLPPKVFIVHRFTQNMVTNVQNIQLRPEVQLVIHMDGWGRPFLKRDTYHRHVSTSPVQFPASRSSITTTPARTRCCAPPTCCGCGRGRCTCSISSAGFRVGAGFPHPRPLPHKGGGENGRPGVGSAAPTVRSPTPCHPLRMPDALVAFALLCFTSLLAIINPLSVVPMYMGVTDGYAPELRRRVLGTGLVTAWCVLAVFALLGGTIFQLFGITIHAFRIAGGIIFFGIGMDMLQARRSRGKVTEEEEREGRTKENVGVTPLGIPMITGPGAITTVMVLMTQANSTARAAVVFGAFTVVLAIVGAALFAAPWLVRFFGTTGLSVMTRLMGLLVTVIGVQFVIDGARPLLLHVIHGTPIP